MTAPDDIVDELVGNAHGNLARVKELLEQHPEALNSIAKWNETAIQAATQMADRAIIEYLIAAGAPVDFFTALVLGRIEVVDRKLAADPSLVHARGVHDLAPLYFAAIGGDVPVAIRLLGAGADVNATAEAGAPIHGAVLGGNVKMVLLLLGQGANLYVQDYKGRDARSLAEELERPDIAELLKDDAQV
jgi:ankyrin repeat protein